MSHRTTPLPAICIPLVALIATVAVALLMTWGPQGASASNFGSREPGNALSVSMNPSYGEEGSITVPVASAGYEEILLNRFAAEGEPYGGIAQAGFYTSGQEAQLDTCSATRRSEEVLFTEWREVGVGYAYECELFGAAPASGSCDFMVRYESNGLQPPSYLMEGSCPASRWANRTYVSWGKAHVLMGGEANNAIGSVANNSSSTATYNSDPELSGLWTIWKAPYSSAELASHSLKDTAGGTCKGWTFSSSSTIVTIGHEAGAKTSC